MINSSIGMIWAQCKNSQYKSLQPSYMRWLIGSNKYSFPSLYEDMRFFLRITRYSVVIMGRKTWDSITSKEKMLAHRYVIVVTRNSDLLCRRSYVKTPWSREQRLFFLPSAQEALYMAQELVKINNCYGCHRFLTSCGVQTRNSYRKNSINNYCRAQYSINKAKGHNFHANLRHSFAYSVLLKAFNLVSLSKVIKEIPSIWICGGEDIYKYFLSYARVLLVTHIDKKRHGDIYAPDISLNEFQIKCVSPWRFSRDDNRQRYRFLAFQRKGRE